MNALDPKVEALVKTLRSAGYDPRRTPDPRSVYQLARHLGIELPPFRFG